MPIEPSGWSRSQRRLHWWTATLVFTAFLLGWLMIALPLRELLLKFVLFQLHKTLGLTVFGFAVYRFCLRARVGRPDWDPDLRRWQRQAAWGMHLVLYALLLAVPVLGYLTAALAPARIPTLFLGIIPVPHVVSPNPHWFAVIRPLHRWAAVLLVTSAIGHAAAALEHHRRGRPVLRQMWRADAGSPPAQP